MIVSEARLAANRKNSLRSTGPKTPEGKARSRANALKHGLCSAVVVVEDAQAVQDRAYEWYYALKPQNRFQSWMVDEVAVLSLRIDRSERMERRQRDRGALRAELCWDDDRRLEAERVGGELARRPAETVERLRSTPTGCEWLMTRWAMLAHAADTAKAWTPDQVQLAFDLLATPAEFRTGPPGASIDFDGRAADPTPGPADLARREVAALRERRDRAADLDDVDRSLAESDLALDADPDLRRLRRYEGTLHSRLRWCLAQLRWQSPHFKPHPDLVPRWTTLPEPAPAPAPAPTPDPAPVPVEAPAPAATLMPKPFEVWMAKPPHPPFDLEPDEIPAPGEEIDIPAIIAARREKGAKKAEAHRQARRRKLERLRA